MRARASEEGDKLVLWCHKQQACLLLGAKDVRGFYRGSPAAGRQTGSMCAAPYSQRLGFCNHQSSRGRATQTKKMLVSSTCGQCDLSQAQSTLDGRLKPKECIPCRPRSMPWLPAEATNSTEGCCGNSCLQPVPSAGNLWAPGWGRNKVIPRSSLTNPCKRSDWQMIYI